MERNIPNLNKDLPHPPPLRKMIGPSFILLGLGLGSGELILWPYLSANYGLGIIWGAVIGITLQFFLNMEIERYTLATGESVFVGLSRIFKKFAPLWFMLTTFIPWVWPGLVASSAKLFSFAFGITYNKYLPMFFLILIGIILSLGKYLYKTQEVFQKTIILIGIPFVLILALFLAKPVDYLALTKGLIGMGDGFWFFPAGLSFATFLGALAYAGAGGNLNLSQSYYIKEKGFGMGVHTGKISSLFSSHKEEMKLEGGLPKNTTENISVFNLWWRRINLEHAIVFWITGAVTMLMLSLLSYITTYKKEGIENGINFLFQESSYISAHTTTAIGTAFLLIASLMLFGTQFSVYASTSRILSENLVIFSPKKFRIESLSKLFYIFLWLQILGGCAVFMAGFTEPLNLVITGAVMNAATMFVYAIMIYILNVKLLPKMMAPSTLRRAIMIIATLFYGGFSIFTIVKYIFKF
ncbi:MAG: hypothetical protein US95_C0001G0029 [Candidatus Woesebacteria bacterium GW2011_GWB1_38_5]|uniref:Uncharacterized protein n=4 Tax=Candidatus Woeseibacteriota TaxID=1752722 RepID=A0A0G0NF57_9BACT|nr:MAG: hypothetical protein US67_C0003G0007 [Candidatus Woesebacteria bacterium GW2011_GWD1_38_10]KKQ56948.1 MAG: hypothetical protein US75_C0001G0005 [Candidatus Woesebacteria bacterium GW2011_GWC1_38_13]KKQ75598.1 MAG: hypothetical protein US95_C0001G0029 [Candidatus Woesebacteria bacterium GW2011_GWB1_38_5]KKQ84544.1 MAG: hypothetical protein UT06_C0003G0017 [Candidatus Woesebacteria bacterium GW2011_GWA1_38_8]